MNTEKTKNKQEVSFYETQDAIIEEIYDIYRVPEKQFAVYSKNEGKISYTDEIELENGKKLIPVETPSLIDNKVILLPSEATGYVSEEKLIEEIKQFIHKYLDIHPFYENIAAHYAMMAWVFDRLSVVPYLRAIGDYGSGKTRFVQTIGALCYKPMFLAGATSDAYIFRVIELFGGTLVINELERVNTDLQAQIVNILNNGYERGMPIGRVEGEKKREPRTFDVFCPKIISTRKKFDDPALESRIITVPMQQTRRSNIPPFISDSFWIEAQELRNKLLMYRFKHFNDFNYQELFDKENKAEKLNRLEPRLRQTLLPLFYVITDPVLKQQFINFALEYQGQLITDRGLEMTSLIFQKLYELYQNNEGKVAVKEVTVEANKEIENDKFKLTSHKVGKIIREDLGLRTKKGTGGLFYVLFTEERMQYLISRYSVESPLTPPSPLPDSDSKVDLVDIEDLPQHLKYYTKPEVIEKYERKLQ